MSLKLFILLFIALSFTNIICQDKKEDKHNPLTPHRLYNSTSKNVQALKLHSKILQTVYSDSFSKNFYYTTLYVGHNKVRQTYIIDTASSIMASPCSPCSECGHHKNPFYYDLKRTHKPLKCSSKICQMTPTTSCVDEKLKFLSSGTCSFKINRASGEGIKGYFMRDIVYFEIDSKEQSNPPSPLGRKVFRSYALPVGCTTAESGKYKELNTDGIMGMNNNPKSFISLLYNLKVVNRNLFTLCFGLRGGYMSLGEIDKTYHKSEDIEYIPLLSSNIYYLVKLNSIEVGDSKTNAIKVPVLASIDTGNSISYFPSIIFKQITNQFKRFCDAKGKACGNFTYDQELGYCASFPDRETLFKSIYKNWPNITLHFGESEYIWKPINYYYYDLNINQRKACLGFNYHSSERVILGANFIHGYDVIFDRNNQRLGFVLSDCSRGNLIWTRWQGHLGIEAPKFEITDPILMDKELHHSEAENKFHLGENRDEMIHFIQGHNTELERKESLSSFNYLVLIISIIIVGIVVIVVLSALLCGKNKLNYEVEENEYSAEEAPNEINTADENNPNPEDNSNKISFEENNPPETNLEDSK